MLEAQRRAKNERMREQLTALKEQGSYAEEFRGQINKFVEQSQRNISQMNQKIATETAKHKEQLQTMNINYQGTLKTQIALLNQNKALNQRKEQKQALFSKQLEQLTQEYEKQIKNFEGKVQINVKRIKELSGANLMQRLLKNNRFKEVMLERGCTLDNLEKQRQLQQICNQVQQVEKEIANAVQRTQQLEQEKNKMVELIDTMKQLLENMVKEKANIVQQNTILKQKLKQSQELITRLLGTQQTKQLQE